MSVLRLMNDGWVCEWMGREGEERKKGGMEGRLEDRQTHPQEDGK